MTSDGEQFDAGATRIFAVAREQGGIPDELIAHYLPRLRAFVRARIGAPLRRRESESDVVQSICRGLLQDRERLEFVHEAEFRAWLFTTALNKIRHKGRYWAQEKRAASREEAVGTDRSLDELSAVYSGVVSPSRVAVTREQIALVEAALERLPEDCREVISLSRLANLPHNEIAEHLG